MAPHSRRKGTGTGRRSHAHSGFDATSAVVQYYGESINSEMIGGWQLPPGSVGDGKIVDGGLDGGTAIAPGTLPPETFDTTPPAEPTGITITSDSILTGDGISMVRLIVVLTHAVDTDLLGVVIQVTKDYTGTAEVPDPDWTYPSEHFMGRENTTLIINGVTGAMVHWVRLRSRDIQGNESDWTSVYEVEAADDSTVPNDPVNLTAVAGFKGIIVKWSRVTDNDLAFYNVRYCLDNGAAAPDEGWTEIQSMTNILWINNLTPGQAYWFDVSAVDRSGNESGVATPVTATPLQVGEIADDIAFGSISTEMIDTDGLNANVIKTGYLAVEAGLATRMDGIHIFDAASSNPDGLVARWDEDGLIIFETDDPTRFIRISAGAIELWVPGRDTPIAAITPDGIDAAALTFGLMPGGQNMIPNSSFEIGAYPAETPYAHTGFSTGAAATNSTYSAGTITITTLP